MDRPARACSQTIRVRTCRWTQSIRADSHDDCRLLHIGSPTSFRMTRAALCPISPGLANTRTRFLPSSETSYLLRATCHLRPCEASIVLGNRAGILVEGDIWASAFRSDGRRDCSRLSVLAEFRTGARFLDAWLSAAGSCGDGGLRRRPSLGPPDHRHGHDCKLIPPTYVKRRKKWPIRYSGPRCART